MTGASPGVRACGNRSPEQGTPSRPCRSRPAPDPSTSARSARRRPRAPPRSAAACRWRACGPASPWLKDPLHCILVEPEQPSDGAIAERRILLDHRLDRDRKPVIDFGRCSGRLVIDRAPRHAEPSAKLGQRHAEAIGQKALMERPDQLPSSRSMRAASFFRARSSSIASP